MEEFIVEIKKSHKYHRRGSEDKAFDQFAEVMIEKLETMQGDWKKPWFSVTALPENIKGRQYNSINSLILGFVCEKNNYPYPVFATRMNLEEAGVSVLEKERAFPAFFNKKVIKDKDGNKVEIDDYDKMDNADKSDCRIYFNRKVWGVYNLDQTDMKDSNPDLYEKLTAKFKEKPMNDNSFSFAPIDKMIAENKWIVPIKPTKGNDAYYTISKKEIVVPLKEQFHTSEGFYGTVTHEMAHSTGNDDYLNRLKPASFGSKDYAKEELIAEMTSAYICQAYGFAKNIKEDSIPYLKSWLSALKEEPRFIRDIMFSVKQASRIINDKIKEMEE